MPPQKPELDEELIEVITAALTGEQGQYYELVGPGQQARVDLVRRCGRTAGRQIRRPVRTLIRAREDGAQAVWVVSNEPIDPDDDLAQQRLLRRMRAAVEAVAVEPGGSEG